jgi:hypothetical protein
MGDHAQQYLDMMNQWLILRDNGISLSVYFSANSWKTMGIYGRHIIREFRDNEEYKVVYGIDRKRMPPYRNVPIYQPDEVSEPADVIVNTIIYDKAIQQELYEKYGTAVVSLEEIIFRCYELGKHKES